MAEPTALDALNGALGEVANGTADTSLPDDDETVTEGDGTEEGGEESGEEGGEGEESTEGDGEESGEESGEGEEGGEGGEQPTFEDLKAEAAKLGIDARANGKFKSAETLAAEIAAKKAAGGEQKEDKGAKKPDAVNDPIDKTLPQKTQERIRSLIEQTKGAEERATKAQADFDFLVQGVQSTGATSQQYGETLSWLKLFNSGDAKQQTTALELVVSVAERLATHLGVELKYSDPLARHPDLQAAVAAKQITPQLAGEMARQRNQAAFRTEVQTHASAEEQQRQQQEQAREESRIALNTLEITLRAQDPQYEAKKAQILPTFKKLVGSIPFAQRAAAFKQLYDGTIVAPPRRTVGGNNGRPNNQPMRAGKNPAGAGGGSNSGMTQQPKSGLDALNGALAAMGK